LEAVGRQVFLEKSQEELIIDEAVGP